MPSCDSASSVIAAYSGGYSIAPVAMIAPCPAIKRGVDADVPIVPGIGERDGRALKIADLQFAVARAFDHILIGVDELLKIHSVRALDVRHEQAARAVFLLHVDRHAQIHVLAAHAIGRAVNLFIAVVHLRVLFERLDHRPGDEMRVRGLALAMRFEMAIDPAAVFVEQL